MTGRTMDGEKLHEDYRRKFWRTLAIAGIGGLPIGFAVGLGAGLFDDNLNAVWTWLPDWLVLLLVGVGLSSFAYGSWRFYRAIDEVELADNLWASTIAFYVYAALFPAWWALGQAEITSDPDHWAIFLASLASGCVIYLWRKWRAH